MAFQAIAPGGSAGKFMAAFYARSAIRTTHVVVIVPEASGGYQTSAWSAGRHAAVEERAEHILKPVFVSAEVELNGRKAE